MFEELNNRRKVVECNIAKGFGIDDADLDFEKALEDELEKGRAKKQFSIGDTFTRHGITYKCTGISPNTGRPTWSKVKDGEGSKQEQPEQKSGSGYGKKIPDEQQKPKKLSELKRGDTVALIMERYNPQLGNYVTIKKVQIEGTTSKSFKVDYMKFDKETGERSDKSSSVYGSSTHYILLPEEVNTHIKDGKWKGDRISGGNPFEDE